MENKSALQVIAAVRRAVIGKDTCVRKVMTALLAGGHVLIEDIPGVGKTTMAMAFSKVMGLAHKRLQFTPDVMPSDITGYSVYHKETASLVYQPGAVMCNLLLADELNRSSPKTQSALLEAMEEGTVTVDAVRRQLPSPFFVIATQNPLGSAGTQPLPPSQVDRFMICLSMGYPDPADEIAIAKGEAGQTSPVRPVLNIADFQTMQENCNGVFVHDSLYAYIVKLVTATRENPLVELGLSPRATISIVKMSKATAFLKGRDYVTPEDVGEIFADTALHRIFLLPKARAAGNTALQAVENAFSKTAPPTLRKTRT